MHGFQSLLRDLATIAKNRVQPKRVQVEDAFDIITTPRPLQRRAMDPLKVSINGWPKPLGRRES